MDSDKKTNFQSPKESSLNLKTCSTEDWKSMTMDSFPPPENAQEKIGKRKMLLKKYFQLQAAKEIQEELEGSEIVDSCFTEYIDNFCNSDFQPFTDNSDYDINKQIKYPLYDGVMLSVYKEQIEKGQLKAHSSVLNFNQPFRKSTYFTTPPELSLRDIEY